mgnify:CR=1 FL=1
MSMVTAFPTCWTYSPTTLLNGLTTMVIMGGVSKGIERSVKILMPVLLVLLIWLVLLMVLLI